MSGAQQMFVELINYYGWKERRQSSIRERENLHNSVLPPMGSDMDLLGQGNGNNAREILLRHVS